MAATLVPTEETTADASGAVPDMTAVLPDRWAGISRPYSADDVERLRPSIRIEHTLANVGARRLWELLTTREFVPALGALSGSQAVQMVRAGLEAIYVSGWQVAADANLAGQTYPDQSLYPANSVPALVRRLNMALLRADQIDRSERSTSGRQWLAPLIADAEAGFGGPLNAFELMKAMIEAGAAGVHFEDQLASEKKCGHLGGKVLVPTGQFIRTLVAARLAADVLDVPTILIARTDADSAKLLTSDIDPRDRPEAAGQKQESTLAGLGLPGARDAWPFLVGDQASIKALADALGFRFAYDPASDQYAHPAVVFAITPDGRISRYLYGVQFSPRDLRLALIEAGLGKTGSIVDRVLLTCYRYDPSSRRYGPSIVGFIRLGGALILALMTGLLAVLWYGERRRRR